MLGKSAYLFLVQRLGFKTGQTAFETGVTSVFIGEAMN
jgi:hypothetical protein